MRIATQIELNKVERNRRIRIVASESTKVRPARRAAIILLCADGLDDKTVGEILGVDRIAIGRWRERYSETGFAAIEQNLPRAAERPWLIAWSWCG